HNSRYMNRRTFLGAVGSLTALPAISARAEAPKFSRRSTSNRPPRKVIIGTAMQSLWGEYPGLRSRLDELAGMVDEMTEQARSKYGRGLDLAVLPEAAVTGEVG